MEKLFYSPTNITGHALAGVVYKSGGDHTEAGTIILYFMANAFALFPFWFAYLSTQVAKDKRSFHFYSSWVVTFASMCYYAMAFDSCYAVVEGRKFYWVRYLDWVFTTPLILHHITTAANIHGQAAHMLYICDMMMIITGLEGALTEGSVKWAWYFFSCAFLLPILAMLLYQLWKGHKVALERDINSAHAIATLCLLTLCTWGGYPIMWVFGEGLGYMDADTEIIVYACLDMAAKPFFALMLLWNNSAIEFLLAAPTVPPLEQPPFITRRIMDADPVDIPGKIRDSIILEVFKETSVEFRERYDEEKLELRGEDYAVQKRQKWQANNAGLFGRNQPSSPLPAPPMPQISSAVAPAVEEQQISASTPLLLEAAEDANNHASAQNIQKPALKSAMRKSVDEDKQGSPPPVIGSAHRSSKSSAPGSPPAPSASSSRSANAASSSSSRPRK